MNLVIIGNDVDDIALDIWKGNTNFTVLNKSPYLWGTNFLEYIKGKEVIVTTTDEQFKSKTTNQFLEYLDKYEFIPIFISDGPEDFVNLMYTAVNELVQDAILYTRNEKNEEYDILIKMTKDYLFKRKESNDKTVRTPRKRKTSTSKK
jgi:hypothetical protein